MVRSSINFVRDITILFCEGPMNGERHTFEMYKLDQLPKDRILEIPGLYKERYVYRVNLLLKTARYLCVLEEKETNPYRITKDG